MKPLNECSGINKEITNKGSILVEDIDDIKDELEYCKGSIKQLSKEIQSIDKVLQFKIY